MHRRIIALVLLVLSLNVAAQNDESQCFTVYRAAMLSMNAECAESGADTLCYGNGELDAELTDNTEPFTIAGHTVNLADVESLDSGAMNVEVGEYGVSLARLSVSEDTTLPLLIFGDVELTNLGAGVDTIDVRVSYPDGAFVRQAPDTTADIVEPVSASTVIAATGRLEDGSWIQVLLPGGEVGWILSTLVTPVDDGTDLSTLDVTRATPETLFSPFRGLTMRSGMLDAPCESAVESGLLTQTPEDTPLTLTINVIDITIDGTVFIQAATTDTVTVNVVEGEAILRNDTLRETITAGNRADMGVEITVTPYNYMTIEPLPLELLPRSVIIALNDWETVLIPATDNPLEGLTNESACTITSDEAINVRVGPGREYPRRGSMLANQSANPTGRGIGTDGRVWWQLTPGAWVSTDVTVAGGDCTTVPLIEVLPRLR